MQFSMAHGAGMLTGFFKPREIQEAISVHRQPVFEKKGLETR